jgi:hypothetical protein
VSDLCVPSNLDDGAKAAVIDEIADVIADAIWAEFIGDSEGH